MSWPDDDFPLPIRDADVGMAQERAMRDVAQGYGGIRTVEWQDSDGAWTRLRTRGGNPVFEQEERRPTAADSLSVQLRGFVASVPGGSSVLFNPYTLAVLKSPYTLAEKLYAVEDFATTWNVPTGDVTHWYDVVLFDGSTIRINAQAMPALGITPSISYPAIPYLINRVDASDQYGNAELNTTQKRVFAVGRYQVQSWGGGGTTQTLTPTQPRSDSKALTIGQRVERATHKAWLGQLYYTGDTWDALSGSWAFSSAEVTMLLTASYLSKIASSATVDLPVVALTDAGASSGSLVTDTLLPDGAELALKGDQPVLTTNVAYFNNGTTWGKGIRRIRWPWTGVVHGALQGETRATYTRSTFSGSVTDMQTQAGVELTYLASNGKQWDLRNEYQAEKAYSHYYADIPTGETNGSDMGADGSTLWWGDDAPSGWDPSQMNASRGRVFTFIGGEVGQSISGSYITSRAYEEQTGVFQVLAGADPFVSVLFSKNRSSGPKAILAPITGYYDNYFLPGPGYDAGWVTIYSYAGSGIGGARGVDLDIYSDPANDDITPVATYYRCHGLGFTHQDPEAADDINGKFDAAVAAFFEQTYYDNENSNGDYSREHYYVSSIQPSVTLGGSSLAWSTRDYLLYDAVNSVYVSIDGSFSGSQVFGATATATLTVTLRVQTRHHTVTQMLVSEMYAYSELLPESENVAPGKDAIPSPQIRAIFAPLYQEQGSFKGAHYVTLAEEGNGATPFHGFNFLLRLRMYGNLATVNEDNAGRDVFFVPCNLLEMLYCFVFSQEYGVAESGDRYPVSFPSRFSALNDSLFSTPFRVAVRNGTAGAWTDALGADFASISNATLWRT